MHESRNCNTDIETFCLRVCAIYRQIDITCKRQKTKSKISDVQAILSIHI